MLKPATHVFTYGSLMYGPVWQRVVTGAYRQFAGRIRGYERRRISGETYPALIRARPESTVRGILYLDVSASDLKALDYFEDEGKTYARIRVPVELEDGGTLEAWTYLYLYPQRVEPAPWLPEHFEQGDLQRFLNTYCRDREV